MKILLNNNMSQAALVKETGLKKATISTIVKQLKNKGIIIETGVGESGRNGGRKPRYLEMNRKNIVALGACFRDMKLTISLVDLKGSVLAAQEESIERNNSSAWIPVLLKRTQEMISREIKPGQIFIGLGFSTGGIYNPSKKAFSCFSSGLTPETRNNEKDINVSEIIQSRMAGMTVAADDFPNAMAMGEMWFGCATGLDDFLYLQVKNTKATIVSGRAVVRGARFYAGEVEGWRYGRESMGLALKRSGYAADVLADLFLNLLLCYSPEKIILSLENLPEGASLDLEEAKRKLALRFREAGLAGLEPTPVEFGRLDGGSGALAAAALMFDEYINSYTLR